MTPLEALQLVHAEYPAAIHQSTVDQTTRDLFKLQLVMPQAGRSLCDVGAGLGAFGPACAALGMRVSVVDDFRDAVIWKW